MTQSVLNRGLIKLGFQLARGAGTRGFYGFIVELQMNLEAVGSLVTVESLVSGFGAQLVGARLASLWAVRKSSFRGTRHTKK